MEGVPRLRPEEKDRLSCAYGDEEEGEEEKEGTAADGDFPLLAASRRICSCAPLVRLATRSCGVVGRVCGAGDDAAAAVV